MKNLFVILLLFSFQSIAFSQYVDPQWYIRNGAPINSETLSKAFKIDTPIITIGGITPPNLTCNDKARNDIFIIYTDNTYYNSRYLDNPLGNVNDYNGNNSLSLKIPEGKIIKHLYFTNLYEGDDFPGRIKISNFVNGNVIVLPLITPTNNVDEILSANHSLKPGTDITLIMDSMMVNSLEMVHPLKISLGEVTDDRIWNFFEFFELANFPGTTNSLIGIGEGQIAISPDLYLIPLNNNRLQTSFVNLRVKNTLDPSQYEKVVFYPKDNFRLTEFVDNLHDPNFIELLSRCKDEKNGGYKYTYKAQVRNDGNNLAEDVIIKMEFPYSFSSLVVNKFDMGKFDSSKPYLFRSDLPVYSKRGDMIQFSFPNAKLSYCLKADGKQQADGYIIFTIKSDAFFEEFDEVKQKDAKAYMRVKGAEKYEPEDILEFTTPLDKKMSETSKKKIISTKCKDFNNKMARKVKPLKWWQLRKKKYKAKQWGRFKL